MPENANRSFAILNNPLVVIGVIAVMLAVTFLAPVFENKEGSYYAKYAGSQNLGNRLFFFFGWLGYSKELAMDMRIYRQDKICDKYNRTKRARSRRMDCLRIWPGDRLDYVQRLQVPYPFCLLAWSMRLFA